MNLAEQEEYSRVQLRRLVGAPESGEITIRTKTDILKHVSLPDYGEVKIVTHAGKVTFVETTVKEKVE